MNFEKFAYTVYENQRMFLIEPYQTFRTPKN